MILTCWSNFTKNAKNHPKITFLKVKIRVFLQKISKAKKGSFELKNANTLKRNFFVKRY